eukprot:m.75751 g.75751  ORF g.75751 m.75751 type:complete len:68 (+) comp12459_c2_seq1:186-389(+)
MTWLQTYIKHFNATSMVTLLPVIITENAMAMLAFHGQKVQSIALLSGTILADGWKLHVMSHTFPGVA